MRREELRRRLTAGDAWDLVVVGGGATGLGVALDAAARGLRVALLEAGDFAQGTSSRSTKLVHGGVRYLAQGNVALVSEALHERRALLRNAPHLARPLPFVMPAYRWWQRPFYGTGLWLYDRLAGRDGLGRTGWLDRAQALALVPTLRTQGLQGGVRYWDGQFDDARLAIALARTALAQGAALLNHIRVTGLSAEGGRIEAVHAQDTLSGEAHTLRTRCVVNATGVWVDALRGMAPQGAADAARALVAPSQGVHLVVDRHFLRSDHAVLVPRTEDGRVLFAVPWLGKVILGTTDTPRQDMPCEPAPFRHEVDFILREAGHCLERAPAREDVRSVWVGLRPLVRPTQEEGASTGGLSREHTVVAARSGLVTVTGGKWTTYRAMAEDVLARCATAGLIPPGTSRTQALRLAGAPDHADEAHPSLAMAPGTHLYGSEAPLLAALPGADEWLWRDGDGGLSAAMVRFAARHEMAMRVEDVLARRSRLLFLDAAAAAQAAPRVAALLQEELGSTADVGLPGFLQRAQAHGSLP